jgi:predicted amidohydrolase
LTETNAPVLAKVPIEFSQQETGRVMARALTVGDDEFKQADQLMRAGRREEAIAAFERLRKEYPATWIDRRSRERLEVLRRGDAKPAPGPGAKSPAELPRTLAVAVVQMRSTSDLADNTARIMKSLRECAAKGARVVVFPECALTGYSAAVTNLAASAIAQAEEQIATVCREANVYAIVGTAWRESGKLLNSASVIAPGGQVIERYHKLQLAERWPQEGDHLSVFSIDGVPCSLIICHDERYPELARLPVLAGSRIIFCVSHESGLRHEQKIAPYRAQIQARAVENGVFVVQANAPANEDLGGSHGQSRIVAPDGNIIHEASIFQEDVVTATLEIKLATRSNALNSLTRGPLRDWWADGIRQVRVIE